MSFIETLPDAEHYETDRAALGYLPNYSRPFSHRPEIYAAWKQLSGALKATMDPRRYELATLAAARELRSSYCMLAHGSVLLAGHLEPDELREIAIDHRSAGLDEVDVAVMDLAEKVAGDATTVTQEDVDRLRSLGLTDAEVLEVVAAAAMRCFFAKVADALGVEPDARYGETLDPALLDALTVGRPVAQS